MTFDDALKHYLPTVWFHLKFIKFKYLGRGEPELALLRHVVEPGTIAIDAGASIGMFATEMAKYAGRVLAFEANPEVAAFARSVAPRNVEVVNVALSKRAGSAALRMPRNRKGHGVTELASIEREHAAESIAIEVETRRLDDFAVGPCSFIKIDVEGHEEALLEGASALIARERPVLLIELIDAYNAGGLARVSARFAADRYECFFLSQGILKPVAHFDVARDQDGRNGQAFIANFLFVPAEKRERIRALLEP
jgi:FkbM family methyltransferase